ncbi:phytanoyl-CoA dioxygenase family protein [Novosphingobium malaysiense]|uniref:phytanoyl-CoA dioxygenase family protein n=1 Tax=Novosphingobium malaysiense TaxID=1348853 RepID=UPI0018CE3CB6|nr:phytanoyl-CoA dioxygenase family protein [Novosphingobium malaysiense]
MSKDEFTAEDGRDVPRYQALSRSEIEKIAENPIEVRDVTEDERSFYYEHGWVKLPELISPEQAAEFARLAEEIEASEPPLALPAHQDAGFRAWSQVSMRHEEFARLCYAPNLGKVAAKLMSNPYFGKRQALRSSDTLQRKAPEKTGGAPTDWHQDVTYFPLDRDGMLVVWIALVDMTPDMGTMRFVDKSHHMGRFGLSPSFLDNNLLDVFPGIAENSTISPPLTMRAGDATVHDAGTIHSAPSNTTDRKRWVYACGYIPADARYTGGKHPAYDRLNLPVGEPLNHPTMPLVGTF